MQIYICSWAIWFSYDEILRKNKEKNDRIKELRAQVGNLEKKCLEEERKCAQSAKAWAQLHVSFDWAEDLMKKRGRELDERDQKIAKKNQVLTKKDQALVEKDQALARKDWEIAALEGKYSLAKYAGGLWAKDQILLRFPEAKSFVAWMEPLDDEPKVDIEGDDEEEASEL